MKILSAAVALTLACASAATASAAAPKVEVRAYVNETCIVADEPFLLPPVQSADGQVAKSPALLLMVVGKIAEALVNQVLKTSAGRIRSDAARKDTRYAVVKETNLYLATLDPAPDVELNGQLGCMTIVAAHFNNEAAGCQQQYLPKTVARDVAALPPEQWRSDRSDDTAANPLRRANICTDGEPFSVYESRIEFSPDGTAYRLNDAGYRIGALLASKDAKAQRAVFYTMEISQPTGAGKADVLTTALVNLGRVGAGARSSPSAGHEGPWLRVPAMSPEARRAYEQQTRVHQEVAAQIDALQRSIARSQRIMVGLDERIAAAGPKLAAPLRQEKLRQEVQRQSAEVELEARRAEYAELPRQQLAFMPVSIEVGVTETKSEKPALLALANVMQQNSGQLASAATSAAGGLIGRSVDAVQGGGDPLAARLDETRAAYYDARLSSRTDAAAPDAGTQLAAARDAYNTARRALGLEPVQ